MQTVFENIIEKLEEMIHPKQLYFCKYARGGCKHLDNDDKDCMECVVENAIDIVKQEAAEYNNTIIDGKYCFQTCACTEKCDKCSRLCNGDIDWYENIDNWAEEYNNGWIPCSELLPAYGQTVLASVCAEDAEWKIIIVCYKEEDFWLDGKIDAWQPLPDPYQPKGE